MLHFYKSKGDDDDNDDDSIYANMYVLVLHMYSTHKNSKFCCGASIDIL